MNGSQHDLRMRRGLERVALLHHTVRRVFDGIATLHLIERHVHGGIGPGQIRNAGNARSLTGAQAAQP